jgi:hypothetical protein
MANYLCLSALRTTLVLHKPRIFNNVSALADSVAGWSSNSFSNLTAFVSALSNLSNLSNLSLSLSLNQSNLILSNLSNVTMNVNWMSNTVFTNLSNAAAPGIFASNSLSNYVTSAHLTAAMAPSIYTSNALSEFIAQFGAISASSAYASNSLSNYVSKSSMATTLSNYVTTTRFTATSNTAVWASILAASLETMVNTQQAQYIQMNSNLMAVLAKLGM